MQLVSRLLATTTKVPDGEIVYAIGDVHGRDDLLERLHQKIEQDLAAAADGRSAKVIYLGDYIDRGPDSRAVLDRLLDRPIAGADPIFLKGNHEDALLRFLDDEQGGERWLSLGAGATIRSYGILAHDAERKRLSADAIREGLRVAVPERHMSFLRSLTLFHASGDYLFVHAGIRPGRPLEAQDAQDMLWIRGPFLRSWRKHPSLVVHGHAASREVVVRHNRICIDTMAFATDRLSCIALHDTTRRFIDVAL